jgi:hypothetical protein
MRKQRKRYCGFRKTKKKGREEEKRRKRKRKDGRRIPTPLLRRLPERAVVITY